MALEPEADAAEQGVTEPHSESVFVRWAQVGECDSLIGAVNKVVSMVEAKSESSAGAAQELTGMADAMYDASSRLSKLHFTSQELLELSTRYRAMIDAVASAAGDLSEAIAAQDPTGEDAARAAMDRAVAQEDGVVDAINRYCQRE
jgi:hypothetical protein